MRFLLLILICFTCLITKASNPPNDTACNNTIHVNYPVVNLTDPNDSLLVRFITFDVCYDNETDLFISLDSISETLYGNENVGIKMLYNRFINVDGYEFLVISKVRITRKNRTVIKIRIKKCKELVQKYCTSSSVLIDHKITFLRLFRIG